MVFIGLNPDIAGRYFRVGNPADIGALMDLVVVRSKEGQTVSSNNETRHASMFTNHTVLQSFYIDEIHMIQITFWVISLILLLVVLPLFGAVGNEDKEPKEALLSLLGMHSIPPKLIYIC